MGTFEPTRRGLHEIRTSPAMGRAMERIARTVGVPAFQAEAPVGPDGDYREHVDVEATRGKDGRRGASLVLSPSEGENPNHPLSITFGTDDTPDHDTALMAAKWAMQGRRRGG